ncbi:NADP-dependent oxidoreductase [Microbacterium sp. NPDC055910]|uniref:NADP-dependent oxidoreductase n=1 Tax=Microbacterium sp. NPDC055910 TaxID=3345659 RepID=UPI0035D8BD32
MTSASATAPRLPERMRAIVFDAPGDPSVLRETTLPVPAPALSELLVRVVAAGINPIDAKTRGGTGVSGLIESFPSTLGYDVSGVVVRAPYESHPMQPGTPVFGMVPFPRSGGTYAEYVVLPSLSAALKPESLSHAEAAGVPLAALTAWGLVVDTARAHAGQRIFIHAGAGGVGHVAVQLAAHFGAHVTATGSERNLSWLRELGASEVVDYRTTRFEDVVSDVDVVIDLIGNVRDDTGTRSLGVLRPGGLYIPVATGSWPDYAAAAHAAGVRATSYKVIPDGRALATIAGLIDSGSLRIHVDDVFDLSDAAAAHALLEQGHARGKIVLRVSDD